jgi:hypothetical protein
MPKLGGAWGKAVSTARRVFDRAENALGYGAHRCGHEGRTGAMVGEIKIRKEADPLRSEEGRAEFA